MWPLEKTGLPSALAPSTLEPRKLLLVDGGPQDSSRAGFGRALCDAYAEGAARARWPLLRLDGRSFLAPAAMDAIRWASRVVLFYPMHDDRPPAPLKGLFARFATNWPLSPLKPARSVITMDIPAFAHRALLRGEGPGNDLCDSLHFEGLDCDDPLLIGSAGTLPAIQKQDWLTAMYRAGRKGG